jgi:hypothetical protein
MSMGSSNQGKQAGTNVFCISGRGFAAVDPERQREIDLENARLIARRQQGGVPYARWAAPAGRPATPRDSADEGGSGRRSR